MTESDRPEDGILQEETPVSAGEADGFSPGDPAEEVQYTPKKQHHLLRELIAFALLLAVLASVLTTGRSRSYYEVAQAAVDARNDSIDELIGCASRLLRVWESAVVRTYDPDTQPFVRPEGAFSDDPLDAVHLLYADPAFAADLSVVREQNDRLTEMREQLSRAPKDGLAFHNALTQLLDNHLALSALVLEPEGEYTAFASRVTALMAEIPLLVQAFNAAADPASPPEVPENDEGTTALRGRPLFCMA